MVTVPGRGRVKYPKAEQPLITMGSIVGKVINLSATGLKMQGPNHIEFPPPKVVFAITLTLKFQAPITTQAMFVRRIGDLYALTFVHPLATKVILTEVEGLQKKYGMVNLS
jgi:hypothetical protein